MRQFDVYQNGSTAQAFAPFLVVLQSHHLDVLDTVIVAPLIRDAALGLSLVDLAVDFANETLVLALSELSSVERRLLRKREGDLLYLEDEIRPAVERLFTGF